MAENSTAPVKTGIWKKRIPTLVGLLLLIVALVAGTFFFQDGLGVFSPRATPETTPKKVRVTNVSDSGFTVSFITDEATAGFVEFGATKDKLSETQTDERDKLSGTVGEYKTHHINVDGLQPNTSYYYVIGTGNGAKFDNEGAPFQIVTARRATPSPAKTVYGTVTTESGAPADGAIVYIAIEGAGELSAQVKSSGSWAIPLSNARTTDKASFAEIEDDTELQILVQGPEAGRTAQGSIIVKESQPVPTLVYGQTEITVAESDELESTAAAEAENDSEAMANDELAMNQTATTEADLTDEESASNSSEIASETTESESATSTAKLAAAERTLEVLVDASESGSTEMPVVKSTQPIIAGQAAAGVVVDIEVHSDNNITQKLVANDDGSFSLDIAALSEELEPGEHTVTYSYIDPDTGDKVTKTQTFIVEGESTAQLAQADTTESYSSTPTPSPTPSPTPYSSENPYPIGGATQSAQSSNTTTSTDSASTISTDSSRTSIPSTDSGMPVSGSVGTTFALIFGGLFFITSGAWSFWASKQFND